MTNGTDDGWTRRRFLRAGGSWAAALALARVASGADDSSAGGTVVRGDAGKRLDAAVRATAGAAFRGAVLVAGGGEVLLARGYGARDGKDAAKSPVAADSLFDIASVTKTITATAVLRLADAGKFALDDPVGKHVPKTPKDKSKLTLRHLLSHTSGLPLVVKGLGPEESADRDRFAACVLAPRLEREPGKRWVYDNHGYSLLAVIVERVAGRPFEEHVRADVFRVAEMESGFVGDSFDAGRLVARRIGAGSGGQIVGDAATLPHPYDWSLRGAGGVVASVLDLHRFDRALRSGKLLRPETLRAAEKPVLDGYGLGWMTGALDGKGGPVWVFHTGSIPGFQAYFARWTASERVFVVLTDESTDPRTLHGPLEAALRTR